MPFFSEIDHQSPEELMRWFTERSREKKVPEEERALWLEEVATRIAKTRPAGVGIQFLLSHIPGVDDVRLRAILAAVALAGKKLSSRTRAKICWHVRSLLGDSRPLVVAEAV